MSTRKIMNAKDLSTNELIYFRGHAKATYMSDGTTTVEDAINAIGNISTAYPQVNHGTSDTTLALTPNVLHIWDEVAALTLTFGEEQSGVANEYLFQFESGSEATTLAVPDDIVWSNGDTPVIESKCTYQISILNNLAAIMKFKKKEIVISEFTINIYEGFNADLRSETYSYEVGMTWGQWVNSDYNTNGYYMIDEDGYVYNNNVGMTASGDTYIKYPGSEGPIFICSEDLIDAELDYTIE